MKKRFFSQKLLVHTFTLSMTIVFVPTFAMAPEYTDPHPQATIELPELPREKDRIYTAIETDRNFESCKKFCHTCASMAAPLISLPLIPLQEASDDYTSLFHKPCLLFCAIGLGTLGNIGQTMCSDCAQEAQEREAIFNSQLHQFSTMSAEEWKKLHRLWEQGSWDYAYGPKPAVRME